MTRALPEDQYINIRDIKKCKTDNYINTCPPQCPQCICEHEKQKLKEDISILMKKNIELEMSIKNLNAIIQGICITIQGHIISGTIPYKCGVQDISPVIFV